MTCISLLECVVYVDVVSRFCFKKSFQLNLEARDWVSTPIRLAGLLRFDSTVSGSLPGCLPRQWGRHRGPVYCPELLIIILRKQAAEQVYNSGKIIIDPKVRYSVLELMDNCHKQHKKPYQPSFSYGLLDIAAIQTYHLYVNLFYCTDAALLSYVLSVQLYV